MTNTKCYPAHGTADGTWHVLIWNGAPYPARWRAGMWRIGYVAWDPKWSDKPLSVVYGHPLDLTDDGVDPKVQAVLEAAVALRDANQAMSQTLYRTEDFMEAVQAYQPYTPPDPVESALAALRASIGANNAYNVESAVMDYLDALDAKGRTDAK